MNLRIILLSTLMMSSVAQAIGTKGGGHIMEGEFAAAGLVLSKKMPYLQEPYKSAAKSFKKAIDETNVICAAGERLDHLVNIDQMAFYIPEEQTAWLDCDRWTKEKDTDGAKITIAHEYFRAAGFEDKTYKYSKGIIPALKNFGRVSAEYGRFQNFASLLDQFNKAEPIDETDMLANAARFSCTFVHKNGEIREETHQYEKKAGRGLYARIELQSVDWPFQIRSTTSKNFTMDELGQLSAELPKDGGPFHRLYNTGKLVFRQLGSGRMIGMSYDKGLITGKYEHTEMVLCDRFELYVE